MAGCYHPVTSTLYITVLVAHLVPIFVLRCYVAHFDDKSVNEYSLSLIQFPDFEKYSRFILCLNYLKNDFLTVEFSQDLRLCRPKTTIRVSVYSNFLILIDLYKLLHSGIVTGLIVKSCGEDHLV